MIYTLRILLIAAFFYNLNIASSIDFESENFQADTTLLKKYVEQIWKFRNNKPDTAIHFGEKAIELAENTKMKSYLPQIYNYLGVVYRNKGLYTKSIHNYNLALHYANTLKDSTQIGYAFNNIGGIYRLQGNYPLAFEYMFKALRVFERIEDKEGIGFCTINIAIAYRKEKNYEKALEYLRYTLKIREETGYKSGIALTLNHIAVVYQDMGKYNAAMQQYKELLKLYNELDDEKGLAAANSGIGAIHAIQKNYDEALNRQSKALEICERIQDKDTEIIVLNRIGEIYLETNQFEKALEYLHKSERTSKEVQTDVGLIETYRTISVLYERTGDFESSLKYYKMQSAISDSLFSEANTKEIARIQADYDLELRTFENINLQEKLDQQKIQNSLLLLITLLVIIIIVILYVRFRSMRKMKEKLAESNQTKDLFFSILAHDLRNPFSTAHGYLQMALDDFDSLDKNDLKEVITRVYESSRKNLTLLENLLDWARTQRDQIQIMPKIIHPADIMRDTIQLFKVSIHEKELTVINNLTDDLKCFCDEAMLRSIFRNLLNNSIKFSYENGTIVINGSTSEKFVEISVKDNGIGMSKDLIEKQFNLSANEMIPGTRNEKGTGLGLILCKKFVEMNGGKISIESSPGAGTEVKITLKSSSQQ